MIAGANPLVRFMDTARPGFVPYLEAGGGGSYNDPDLEEMGPGGTPSESAVSRITRQHSWGSG